MLHSTSYGPNYMHQSGIVQLFISTCRQHICLGAWPRADVE